MPAKRPAVRAMRADVPVATCGTNTGGRREKVWSPQACCRASYRLKAACFRSPERWLGLLLAGAALPASPRRSGQGAALPQAPGVAFLIFQM